MFSNYLSSIEDIAKYPEFTLILFVAIFIIVLVRTLRMDKELIEEMSSMPLDSSELNNKAEN